MVRCTSIKASTEFPKHEIKSKWFSLSKALLGVLKIACRDKLEIKQKLSNKKGESS